MRCTYCKKGTATHGKSLCETCRRRVREAYHLSIIPDTHPFLDDRARRIAIMTGKAQYRLPLNP